MGLDINGIRFLLSCRKAGVDFRMSAMVGRQCLYATPKELAGLHARYCSYLLSNALVDGSLPFEGYAEELFKALGAVTVHSFDASEYESATHLHDMNTEVGEDYKGRYSVVLDGGSLEHVFNFPVAIKNCMEMVEVGGHFLGITPSNNFFGHGFYQFSPELYFNVFKEAHGFRIKAVIVVEHGSVQWYKVTDPNELGRRVTLLNKRQTYLLVVAEKLGVADIFRQAPQQTDYFAVWRESAVQSRDSPLSVAKLGGLITYLKSGLSQKTKARLKSVANTLKAPYDPVAFKKIDELEF